MSQVVNIVEIVLWQKHISFEIDGRFLMYFKEERTAEDGSGGESSLYSIDLTGFNERKVITPLGGSDPAWSPLMH